MGLSTTVVAVYDSAVSYPHSNLGLRLSSREPSFQSTPRYHDHAVLWLVELTTISVSNNQPRLTITDRLTEIFKPALRLRKFTVIDIESQPYRRHGRLTVTGCLSIHSVDLWAMSLQLIIVGYWARLVSPTPLTTIAVERKLSLLLVLRLLLKEESEDEGWKES